MGEALDASNIRRIRARPLRSALVRVAIFEQQLRGSFAAKRQPRKAFPTGSSRLTRRPSTIDSIVPNRQPASS
jgi:hypothetical protein